MNTPAAFRATYSDWRLVKTRGVVQVIFEVPLADSDNAYEILGGMPQHGNERWFGIAAIRATTAESIIDAPDAKTKEQWKDCAPSKQAGIRCSEPLFWAYLREEHAANPCATSDDAASFVRAYCRVNSRAHFNANPAAKAVWQSLDNQFQAWKAAQQ